MLCVHTLSIQVCTNVVAWDDQMDLGSPVHKVWEFLNRAQENACHSRWNVPRSSRAMREEWNEWVTGGLRNAARRDQVAQIRVLLVPKLVR